MRPFIILKLYLQSIFQSTLYACACSCIRQKVNGIAEKEIVAGHGCAIGNVFHLQTIRQYARTMYLNAVVKDEDTNGRIPIEWTVDKGVDHKLNQTAVWNFKFAQWIKLFLHLYVSKITGKERHDGFKLMQQIALHVGVIHFVTELLAAYIISYKTDTFGRHHRQPTLGVFAKQQHGCYRQVSVRADKAQIAHQLVQVVAFGNGTGNVIERSFAERITHNPFLF